MPLIQIEGPFSSLYVEHSTSTWDSTAQCNTTQRISETLCCNRSLWLNTDNIVTITHDRIFCVEGITIIVYYSADMDRILAELVKYQVNQHINDMLR